MYVLLELSDKDLMIYLILTTILLIIACISYYISDRKHKIKPISENLRFDANKVTNVEEALAAKKELDQIQKTLQQEKEIIEPVSKPIENSVPEIQNNSQKDIEELYNKMKDDLKEEKVEVQNFEDEQEANAIISYQELLDKASQKSNIQLEPIEPKEEKKFHSSEIISPIYGIQNKEEKKAYSMSTSYSVPDNEENIEFLQSLKDFRSKL